MILLSPDHLDIMRSSHYHDLFSRYHEIISAHDLIHGVIFILPCPIRGSVHTLLRTYIIDLLHISYVHINLWNPMGDTLDIYNGTTVSVYMLIPNLCVSPLNSMPYPVDE